MAAARGSLEARPPMSLLLLVRSANQPELDAFAEAAYLRASERVKNLITLEQLKRNIRDFCHVMVVTDCLNTLLGGLALDVTDPLQPRLCWAWLEEDLRSLGLARDMAKVLIANHMVLDASPDTVVGTYTAERHIEAEKGLRAMHFASRELQCAAAADGATKERGLLLWWLDYDDLTALLEEAKRLTPSARRSAGPTGVVATIELHHPMTRDAFMKLALASIVRERQRPDEED
jgi:hypothetical protein